MISKSTRIEQQITTFGHPLAHLVQNRQLPVRLPFAVSMHWVRTVNRWHQRYERQLRSAGRQER